MTKKKYYRIDINVVSTSWETCECYIEAESEEEARKKFDADDHIADWDNWEMQDSEIRSWDVESVEYDEWMTKHSDSTLLERMENKDDSSM